MAWEGEALALAHPGSIILLGVQTCTLASLLPRLDLAPCSFALGLELIVARTEFRDGLLGQELLQGPLLNILGLVLLELRDELDRPLQDRTLVLLAAGYNLCELIDALIDSLSAAALN